MQNRIILGILLTAGSMLFFSPPSWGFTADKTWFEFRKDGSHRIKIRYINLQLLKYQEASVDFISKPEAELFFNQIIKGIDFYFGPTGNLVFPPQNQQGIPPLPW